MAKLPTYTLHTKTNYSKIGRKIACARRVTEPLGHILKQLAANSNLYLSRRG